jgi:hypothetical protein
MFFNVSTAKSFSGGQVAIVTGRPYGFFCASDLSRELRHSGVVKPTRARAVEVMPAKFEGKRVKGCLQRKTYTLADLRQPALETLHFC